MKKRAFSHAERYAVWFHRDKRFWFCEEPLRFYEATIDHVIPETFLVQKEKHRKDFLRSCGLPSKFKINGFENWLPCHHRCNQKKGDRVFRFAPAHKHILDKLIGDARKVELAVLAIKANATKDALFARIAVALEKKAISHQDLLDLATGLRPEVDVQTSKMIRLSTGYWIRQDDVVRISACKCERDNCVDFTGKVECLFANNLSPWVINTGLYWKCYDEIVKCPRCGEKHARGHIGRYKQCGRPFADQKNRRD